MQSITKSFTAIIKVVGNFCNLRCKYCFYQNEDQLSATVMSLATLEHFIEEYLKLDQLAYTFIWHGGEPLAAGKDFFYHVIKFQEKYNSQGKKIKNRIQTNATLIDNEWAIFLKENDFGVGISLDGCRSSHNRFRIRADGVGSFDDVSNGIEVLHSHGVKAGYIQTIAKENLVDLSKNFSFFVDDLEANNWAINFYMDHANSLMQKQTVSSDEMAEYVIKSIELWLERDDPKLKIREIDNFFQPFLGRKTKVCNFNGKCSSYICVDWDGIVYPCDRLSIYDEYELGDLKNQSLSEIVNGLAMTCHEKKVSTLPDDCISCKWLEYCHNGCTADRVPSLSNKYFYCDARKKIFEYVEKLVRKFDLVL